MAKRKAVAPEIVHPPWCRKPLCEVKPQAEVAMNFGNHRSGHWNRMRPARGEHVSVDVVQHHSDRHACAAVVDELEIEMTIRNDDLELTILHLEPEEARQLARYLTEAAGEWERCRALAAGADRG